MAFIKKQAGMYDGTQIINVYTGLLCVNHPAKPGDDKKIIVESIDLEKESPATFVIRDCAIQISNSVKISAYIAQTMKSTRMAKDLLGSHVESLLFYGHTCGNAFRCDNQGIALSIKINRQKNNLIFGEEFFFKDFAPVEFIISESEFLGVDSWGFTKTIYHNEDYTICKESGCKKRMEEYFKENRPFLMCNPL